MYPRSECSEGFLAVGNAKRHVSPVYRSKLASNRGCRTDTGRWSCTLKELINNGGERISPIAISKVLGKYITISEAMSRQ
jgi:hypothetical protein